MKTGSTKFTRFETVTSSCVTSLTDRPVASARRATLGIQKHSEPALLTFGAHAQRGLQYLVCHSVCHSVFLSVCPDTLFWQYARLKKYNERYHRVKRQICGNIKMAFYIKLSYSKVRAFFTYLSRGGHF